MDSKTTLVTENKSEMEKIFTDIYNKNSWNGGSGPGSFIKYTKFYNRKIKDFLRENKVQSVCDLGCGDWQSTHLIYQDYNCEYTGYDCVPSVISANKRKYSQYNFELLDFKNNVSEIKDAEVYIIKDVLQHWKLKDIYSFLDQISQKNFKWVIITNGGRQNRDNTDIAKTGHYRSLNSNFLPLKNYAKKWFDYQADEFKHVCIITKE